MKTERIYKKEDGSRYRITVSFHTNSYDPDFGIWNMEVCVCAPGKRKFEPVVDVDDYRYRCLSAEDRERFRRDKMMECIPEEWVRETQEEIIDKIRKMIM